MAASMSDACGSGIATYAACTTGRHDTPPVLFVTVYNTKATYREPFCVEAAADTVSFVEVGSNRKITTARGTCDGKDNNTQRGAGRRSAVLRVQPNPKSG